VCDKVSVTRYTKTGKRDSSVTMHDFGFSTNVDAEIHFPLLSINSNNHRNRIMDSSEELSTSDAAEENQTLIVFPATSFSTHPTLSQLIAAYAGEALQYSNRLKHYSTQQHLALDQQIAESQQAFLQQIVDSQQAFTDQNLQLQQTVAHEIESLKQQRAKMQQGLTHKIEESEQMLQDFAQRLEPWGIENPVRYDDSLPVSTRRQQEYYSQARLASTIDIAIETKLLSFNHHVMSQLGIGFTHVSIDVRPIFFKQPIISLDMFKQLQNPMHDEKFFPKNSNLFLRPAMTVIMKRFLTTKRKMHESDPDADQWVLVGSPGIGKSLLFFLGAVAKVVRQKEHILYFRKSGKEDMSIFYLFPNRDNVFSVNFFFKRFSKKEEIMNNKLRSLEKLLGPVYHAVCGGPDVSRKVLLFLDGPNYIDEKKDTLEMFDYICTSGGYPLPKNSNTGLRLWVLNGWNCEDMKYVLCKVHGTDVATAENIYSVCGGCMRDAVKALTKDGLAKVKQTLTSAIERLGDKGLEIVSTQTETTDGNYDRLRMMFVTTQNQGNSMNDVANLLHVVDSAFVLDKLRCRLTLKQLLDVYMFAKLINSRSAQGAFYEQYWHKWFSVKLPCGITVLESSGNWNESILQLVKDEQYWIPSKDNFPQIDAAIIRGHTLYALQYTVQPDKNPFDVEKFSTFFLVKVSSNMDANWACQSFKHVIIVYVVPLAVNFKVPTLINVDECVMPDLDFSIIVVEADPKSDKTPEFPFFQASLRRSVRRRFGLLRRK
jgi:hypothetical protein